MSNVYATYCTCSHSDDDHEDGGCCAFLCECSKFERKRTNKRQLKRDACFHASQILKSALEGGWDLTHERPELYEPIQELIEELKRRGWRE